MAKRSIDVALVVAALVSGCIATPLPTPPTADPERMSLTPSGQASATLAGEAGAIHLEDPGVLGLRVTAASAWTQVSLSPEGAFTATLPAAVTETFHVEAVYEDRDLYLIAVTGLAGGGSGVIETAAGTDRDGDGSPDAVDCAPEDPSLTGRRCPEDCVPAAEICNGIDDDCDGSIDEGCGSGDDLDGDGFDSSTDCDDADATVNPAAPELCNAVDDDCDGEVDEDCAGACADDSDCSGGQLCVSGACACDGGLELCSSECVDTATDDLNCGECGRPCPAGQSCVASSCVP